MSFEDLLPINVGMVPIIDIYVVKNKVRGI